MTSSDTRSNLTLDALLAQPDNAGVWQYLKVSGAKDIRSFEAGCSTYDTGGQVFFHQYGRLVPTTARCVVCAKAPENLFAHERTARVFALHTGRFTIALRPGFTGEALDLCGPLYGETLDGLVDLRVLGPDWLLFHTDDSEDEAPKVFLRAYLLAGEGTLPAETEQGGEPERLRSGELDE